MMNEKIFANEMMSEAELDNVVGGKGYVYYRETNNGNKLDYVVSETPLSIGDARKILFEKIIPMRKNPDGSVSPLDVSIRRGLPTSNASNMVKKLNEQYGGCDYMKLK